MEYTEYVIKIRVAVFTGSGTLLHVFFKFNSFRALGTGKTLTAITHQRITYFKAALLFVAQGLLNTLISVTIFWYRELGRFLQIRSHM